MSSRRIRAVFLDAGNTLVFPRLEEVIRDLNEQGFPATREDFYAAERLTKRKLDAWLWPQLRSRQIPNQIDFFYWKEFLQAITKGLGIPEDRQADLVARLKKGLHDIAIWSLVMPDSPALLERLVSQGYYMGVISNSAGTLEGQLARLGLARYFRTILDSSIVGIEKPHPGIFKLALQNAGVDGSEAIFVGDTYAIDVGGAQLAGLTGVLMDLVGAYPDAECLRIASLPELEKILEELQ